MARARNIKPSFFMNEDLIELPFEARLLFIGLWTLADREGRLENRPKKIKMSLFPADEINVIEQLSNLSKYGFIQCYHSNDLNVIQIVNFAKHQVPHGLEKDSLLPDKNGFYTVFDRVKKVAKGKPRLLTHAQLIAEQDSESSQSIGNASVDNNNQNETGQDQVNNSYETVSIDDQNALNPESLNLNPDSLNHKNPHSNAGESERAAVPKAPDQQTYGQALTPQQIIDLWQPDQSLLAEHLKFALAQPVTLEFLNKILVKFNAQYEHQVLSENKKYSKLAGWIKDEQAKQAKEKQNPHRQKPKLDDGNCNARWEGQYKPEPIEFDQEQHRRDLAKAGLF